jgi:ABC-type transport system substrate-binding protein
MYRYRIFVLLAVLTSISLVLTQCSTPTPQIIKETVVVKETVPVEKVVTQVVEKVATQVVEKQVEKVVTPTPQVVPLPNVAVATDKPVRGGTIRATWVADVPNLGDPPPSWDAQSWTSHMLLYSGLLRFKAGSADVEPELAESLPAVSADGKVYTFKLRPGLKFSSGRALTAADVKYSLDRMLDDKTQGWGVTYYMAIKGAPEAFAGTADGVSGIRVKDERTIEIELSEALSPSWFNALMAVPWTYVVDKEAVEKYGDDFRIHPAGAGPYVLKEYVAGQRVVYERNPNYWRNPEEPYADRVEIELGVDTAVGALKLEKGEVDLVTDPLPPTALKPFLDNPAWRPFIAEAVDTGAYFLALDASQGLTKDIRVRQAIAHAIDKEKMIQIIGGSAIPAKSLLSPSTGIYYDPNMPEYKYDPEKAKSLLKEAGVAEGTKIEFWCANFYPWREMAQAVQEDLEAIGLSTDLHLVGRAAWYEANGQHNPIVFNQWPLELPDPAYIFDGGFSKAAFYPNSCCNWSWYTTDELEGKLNAARREPDPAKRAKLYQALDREVVYDKVLWVPLFHLRILQVRSPRLGGYVIPQVLGPSVAQFFRYWVADGK